MNVYLDYAATSPLDEEIFSRMMPFLKEEFGNPSSPHAWGRKAAYAVQEARDRVAGVLGVQSKEVYFTSGGTEADNFAVRKLGSGEVCVSALEHSAVLSSANERGASVAEADGRGIVTAQEVERALTDKTGLVCVMAVNNETGCIQPLEEIGALCKQRGIPLFSDCVQAACTQDLKAIAKTADALALSAHKIYGPKGVGALIVKSGNQLSPLIAGGEQERGMRGGTLNTAGIVGFSYALEAAQRECEAFSEHAARLRGLFESKIKAALGEDAKIDGENRAPNISHITFATGGTALLNLLDLSGIACSGGAACSAQSALPSHVLIAMGRSAEEALKGARFSFGKNTSEEETLYAAQKVIDCVKK